MSSFRVRPRFKHMSGHKQEEIIAHMKELLGKKKELYTYIELPNQIIIKIPKKDRHFWSPQLALSFEDQDNGTIIRGLYGPDPSVWTVFFFSYSILFFLILLSSMIGLAQLYLDMPAMWLWGAPVCIVLLFIVYLVAQMGQKIGATQMFDLHHFYEGAMEDKVKLG